MQLPFIPYFQTTRYRVEAMIDLAGINRSLPAGRQEKAADLGSGDGRIVIALSQAGAIVTGYELDEKLVELSRKNIEETIPNGLSYPTILQKDFWEEDLGQYDIITVYPMPDIMEALEKKLQRELRPGARVLLNYYPFPNWEKTAEKDHIFLYRKS